MGLCIFNALGSTVMIGDIAIRIQEIRHGKVKLDIDADRSVKIYRGDLVATILQGKGFTSVDEASWEKDGKCFTVREAWERCNDRK